MNNTEFQDFVSDFQPYSFPEWGWVRLPEIKIENKVKEKLKLSLDCSNFDILAALVFEGWKEKRHKFNQSKIDKYSEQLQYEMDLVEELGFTDYFLLVWIVVNKARELGAFIDWARGSAGASLIFYLINVTGIDPIDKNLIFQRFISKVRAKKKTIDEINYLWGDLAPDVDLNVGGVREKLVIWLNQLYEGKMCRISAISTLTGKMLIKDVYKTVEEAKEEDAKYVAGLIDKNAGFVEDIENMPEKSKEFKTWSEEHPKTFKIALKLRNLIRQKTSHASGYLISYYSLDGFIPLEVNREGDITTSYEMDDIANFAIKLDLLGLTSNEILKDILDNIPETPDEMNLDSNPIIYDQFQTGKLLPYGLYQVSADCTYRVLNKVKPKNILELSDVNALARPGALAFVDDYTSNKAECPHPIFKDVLGWTRNVCLYQEEAMKMAMAIGFSADDAELIRRAIGKKKVDEIKTWKEKIYQKTTENKLPQEVGDLFWQIVDASSRYQFNFSHSLGTAYLTAITVYCKYKYPLQFYTACLKATKNLPNPLEEIAKIHSELGYFKIKLLPPHILKSGLDFQIEGNNIRYGLGQIKGIAEKTINKLNSFKSQYSNKFEIFRAAKEAQISNSVLNCLILVGALDNDLCNQTRGRIVLESQIWNLLTDKEQTICFKLGEQFNYDLMKILIHLNETAKDEKGKPILKDSRRATIRKHYTPYLEIYNYNKKNELVCKYWHEYELLGYSYSIKLIDLYKEVCSDLMTIAEINDAPSNTSVHFVARVLEVREGIARNEKKTKYLKCLVKDETGSISVMLFNDAIEDHIADNKERVDVNDIVVIKGKRKGDSVFAYKIGVQSTKILRKVSDLKEIEETSKK